jgi:CO/xanthine dehydrogenase Mo-binding subunit
MDMLARKLNMDPIEFRLKNAAGEGYQIPSKKGYLGTTAIRPVLKAAADYLKKEKTPREKYRGWGVSCSQWGAHSWHTPAQASSAWVAVNDYKLPGVTMTPRVEKKVIQVPSSFGPYGVRGVGEPPNVLVAPAIANAVCDALGVRVTELPLTPERVFSALKQKPTSK